MALVCALPLWSVENTVHSRGHSFEITVGGGYSSLGYKVNEVSALLNSRTIGSYSAQGHLGYNWFFTEYVGLGVGLDVEHYGQSAKLDGQLVWEGVTDTDGEKYDHHLALNKWSETQDYWTFEIPVSLVFSIPVQDKVYITLQAGGKYGIPLTAGYSGKGELTHTGYYKPWDLTLMEKPNHGFYSETAFTPKGAITRKNYWSVFAKAGVAIPLVEHLDLLVQAYFNYALTEVANTEQNGVLGFRDDRPGQEQTHYFMDPYIGLGNTAVITDAFKPWSVGLEVGIRYTITPERKAKYPCRCMDIYDDPL